MESMNDAPVLEVSHVRREFGRDHFVAVDDVSLAIRPGEVHALLGPNGAGKTTLVKMCATLLAPTAGSIRICGGDVVARPRAARSKLGLVLGGDLGFYHRATARDNLLFFADMQGVPTASRREAVDRALTRVRLEDAADRRAGTFSRGMYQRLHIARALLADAPLMLLDEPTTGLDPDVALQVRDIVHDLAAEGRAILLTSHIMAEVEELASSISVIIGGRVAVRGQAADIAASAGVSAVTTVLVDARHGAAEEALAAAVGEGSKVVRRAHAGRWLVTVFWDAAMGAADRAQALSSALDPLDASYAAAAQTRPATLEEAYVALVGGRS